MTEQEQDVIKHFQTSKGTRVERIQLGSHHISQRSCTFPGWDTTLEGVSHLGGHCVTEEVGAPFCCPSMGGMTVWAVSAMESDKTSNQRKNALLETMLDANI